jgi:preprotein translocase subunit SecG
LEFIYTFLSILLVIDSILLVVIILMQKTKGAEIGAVFGSGAASAVLGAGAANILTKLTYWIGGIFLALVFALTFLHHKIMTTKTVVESIPVEVQQKSVPQQTKEQTQKTVPSKPAAEENKTENK